MNLIEKIKSKAVYSISLKKHWQEYDSFQWKTKVEQKNIQLGKLKKIVSTAVCSVPFYKKLNLNIDFEHFSAEELKKFPIVDKDIIRKNFKDFVSSRGDGKLSHTSGSTGNPFKFKIPYESDVIEDVVAYRAWGMGKDYSYRPGDPVIALRTYCPKNGEPLTKIMRSQNYWYLSPFHINEKNLDLYVEFIVRSKARIIRSYSSAMYIFSFLLKDKNVKLPQIKTLVTSSETLLPIYRESIEAYWGIPVLDWYGQNERTVTIQQCWAGNYHNNDDYGFVEIDEHNNIIATSLNNTAMPFIRYNTNDKAIPLREAIQECPCGRNMTIPFEGIEGRSDDILVRDDGTIIPTANFSTAMKSYDKLKQFQIIQDENKTITLKLVTDNDVNASYLESIAGEVIQRLGEVKINVEIVDEIERDVKTGKIKVTIQKVSPSLLT
jgi:phenylacetate-CoA ligase